MLELKISDKYLSLLLSQQKTLEGRFNSSKYSELRVGDVIVLKSTTRKHLFKITSIDFYKDITEMLQQDRLQKLIPNQNIDIAHDVYDSFKRLENPDLDGMIVFGLVPF